MIRALVHVRFLLALLFLGFATTANAGPGPAPTAPPQLQAAIMERQITISGPPLSDDWTKSTARAPGVNTTLSAGISLTLSGSLSSTASQPEPTGNAASLSNTPFEKSTYYYCLAAVALLLAQ